jgi:hypothetical protein
VHLADALPELQPYLFLQAFELIKGNLVRFSSDAQSKNVPTAVLVHGILGSRRNLHSFAHMIVEVSLVMLQLKDSWFPCVFSHVLVLVQSSSTDQAMPAACICRFMQVHTAPCLFANSSCSFVPAGLPLMAGHAGGPALPRRVFSVLGWHASSGPTHGAVSSEGRACPAARAAHVPAHAGGPLLWRQGGHEHGAAVWSAAATPSAGTWWGYAARAGMGSCSCGGLQPLCLCCGDVAQHGLVTQQQQ